MSDDHFTVDGTLIEAWASLKSFRPKGEERSGDKDQGDPGNRWVDFHGEKRSNDTHESSTDPDSLLMRKGPGKEAKLCYGAHALMENRNGLLVDLEVSQATGSSEREAAENMIKRQRRKGLRVCRVPSDSEHWISESCLANNGWENQLGGSDGQTESVDGGEALSNCERGAEPKGTHGANRQAASSLRGIDLPVA
jgi:hypothetical protein